MNYEVKIHLVGGKHLRLTTTKRGARQVMDAVGVAIRERNILDLSTAQDQRFIIGAGEILHAEQNIKEDA